MSRATVGLVVRARILGAESTTQHDAPSSASPMNSVATARIPNHTSRTIDLRGEPLERAPCPNRIRPTQMRSRFAAASRTGTAAPGVTTPGRTRAQRRRARAYSAAMEAQYARRSTTPSC
jgi:hypothetical protein